MSTIAVPMSATVMLTGACGGCGQTIGRTVGADLTAVGAWHHTATGLETCSPTPFYVKSADLDGRPLYYGGFTTYGEAADYAGQLARQDDVAGVVYLERQPESWEGWVAL